VRCIRFNFPYYLYFEMVRILCLESQHILELDYSTQDISFNIGNYLSIKKKKKINQQ